MSRCPHCTERVRLLRVMIVTHWTPYRCPCCGGRSRVPTHQIAIPGGLFGGLMGVSGASILREYGWLGLLAALLIGLIVVTYICARCTFEPIPSDSNDRSA